MGRDTQRGFTIIEVILFVAVSGLMLSLMMVGIGRNIEQQHYRDSVQNLRDILAGEFESIQALTNDRNAVGLAECGSTSGIKTGASECFYAGKLILIRQNRTISYPVIAKLLAGGTDETAAASYTYEVDVDKKTQRDVLWGVGVGRGDFMPGARGSVDGAVYIARHPGTGQMMTLINPDVRKVIGTNPLPGVDPANPPNLFMPLVPPLAQEALSLCLVSGDSGITPSQEMAVKIPVGIRSATDLKVEPC